MPAGPARIPSSTYRLQITEDFDLDAALAVLPYLDDLGVGWLYLSPLLEAHPGSNHGYDVVDPTRVDPARGGPDALARLSAEARRRGIGIVVDIVPNHLGVETPATNGRWWDVLEHGRDSRFASFFDIDWASGGGKLQIPVVGDDDLAEPDGAIGNLCLVDGMLGYHDHRFPLAPGSDDSDDPQVVHHRQHYQLVSWRAADQHLNYRRFFAVNTLAGIRVEDREVFDATHAGDRSLVPRGTRRRSARRPPGRAGHPAAYLDELAGLTDSAWVVVEKILEPGEELPERWRTAGTTGYDALALIDRVLVDPAGEAALNELDDRLRGGVPGWAELIHDTKRDVARTSSTRRYAASHASWPVSSTTSRTRAGRQTRSRSWSSCSQLPGVPLLPARRAGAPGERCRRGPPGPARPGHGDRPGAAACSRTGGGHPARFQQTSGMVMAKGVEDPAFYRYSRLTSLTEVGADPAEFSIGVGRVPRGDSTPAERTRRR